MRHTVIGLFMIGSILLLSRVVRAEDEKPDGTVRISSGSVAVGNGVKITLK